MLFLLIVSPNINGQYLNIGDILPCQRFEENNENAFYIFGWAKYDLNILFSLQQRNAGLCQNKRNCFYLLLWHHYVIIFSCLILAGTIILENFDICFDILLNMYCSAKVTQQSWMGIPKISSVFGWLKATSFQIFPFGFKMKLSRPSRGGVATEFTSGSGEKI